MGQIQANLDAGFMPVLLEEFSSLEVDKAAFRKHAVWAITNAMKGGSPSRGSGPQSAAAAMQVYFVFVFVFVFAPRVQFPCPSPLSPQ
jgi:hypothetical protein